MKYFNISAIQGIVKDYHPRMIPESRASDGNNILFEQGRIKSRWGYALFGSLNGTITNIIQYERINGTKYLIVFTTRDSYVYRGSRFDFLTKCYNTGSVSCYGVHVSG